MLKSIRQIDSIRDLIPFFSHVSISSYESVYASSGNIDWEAVEQGILDDMFDGRWHYFGFLPRIYIVMFSFVVLYAKYMGIDANEP